MRGTRGTRQCVARIRLALRCRSRLFKGSLRSPGGPLAIERLWETIQDGNGAVRRLLSLSKERLGLFTGLRRVQYRYPATKAGCKPTCPPKSTCRWSVRELNTPSTAGTKMDWIGDRCPLNSSLVEHRSVTKPTMALQASFLSIASKIHSVATLIA